jgi:hypothetical protein
LQSSRHIPLHRGRVFRCVEFGSKKVAWMLRSTQKKAWDCRTAAGPQCQVVWVPCFFLVKLFCDIPALEGWAADWSLAFFFQLQRIRLNLNQGFADL